MKQRIFCWITVVAGAYAVKGLLLPIVAAIMLAGGQESVTMMSYALGGIFLVSGLPVIASAITDGDMPKLGKCAMAIILGIIFMIG